MRILRIFPRRWQKQKFNKTYLGLVDFIQNGATTAYESSPVLTEETLNHMIKSLQINGLHNQVLHEELSIHHIDHNVCEEKMKKAFGFNLSENEKRSEVYLIAGYRVFQRSYIPKGEMWMCNKKGRVLKMIKLL